MTLLDQLVHDFSQHATTPHKSSFKRSPAPLYSALRLIVACRSCQRIWAQGVADGAGRSKSSGAPRGVGAAHDSVFAYVFTDLQLTPTNGDARNCFADVDREQLAVSDAETGVLHAHVVCASIIGWLPTERTFASFVPCTAASESRQGDCIC